MEKGSHNLKDREKPATCAAFLGLLSAFCVRTLEGQITYRC